MKSKDENQTKVKHDKEVDSKRKKFLNKVAMATAFVGVTGIGIQNLPEVKEVSAMMKVPTTRPQSPSLKPGGMFAGSTGGFRPVSPSVGIGKNPISSPIKNPVNNSTIKNPVNNSTIKNPVTSSTNKPNNGTSTIKPGNTGTLVNKFEGMNNGSGNTPISTKPPSPSTNKPITAPPKPNTGTGIGTTAPPKPNMGTGMGTQSKPNTGTGMGTQSKPNTGTGTGTTTAPPKPNTGTQSKPQTGNTTTGSTNGLSQNKPGGNTNLDSGKKPVITQTNSGGSTAGKPGGSLTNKPGGSTTGGISQNGSKPGTSGTGQNTSKPGTSGSGNSAGASGSTAGKPGSGSLTSKPGGSTTGGTSQNGSKPGTSGTGQNTSKPGGATNNTGKPNNIPSGSSSNSLAGDDTPTNTRRVSSTTTNNTTNNTTNTTQTGGKDRFGKVMGVIGLVSTVAFLGTSVAGILQGEKSLEAQRELQEEAIKAQQQLAENQQREEYEKLAAQLGGKYDPDRGVIVLPDGSELNVVTGIVTYPDGSWVDQNGNLHLPGGGTIDKDGNINLDGIGTVDKDGNLVLEDGSGYFDSDGNFHPSGEINTVKGVSGGVGFGGMHLDTQFGGMKVLNQSGNYGYKAYDKNAYDEALAKSHSHSSVEEGIFTAREYDAIVNLILSAKLNENIAKQMEKDGQLTSAQLEVVLKLLDSFNSSGKI
ncbi:hypothetical protein [Candidatus Arthromitus sp. SFB-turkey]|uniref:hypothetical protein n=1 Tax=Candidatus Arthromitus sp. SFB-turkey TaxID=1840217 RepID=UPI0007F35188|nr:hypothetical protein [Candidatus Arthromitus sp. SFB-turkey]OAT89996.1 hypothetical protein A6P36_06980 [Candidatus Arthromitus sp. SFB-turkey]